MIVYELMKLLETYPQDWPVLLEVKGAKAPANEVDMESGEGNVWVIITDYKESV